MPYRVKPVGGGRYRVVNAETGAIKARRTTRARAQRQVNLLRGREHGFVPTGRKARDQRR